jgi:hypothetical protein
VSSNDEWEEIHRSARTVAAGAGKPDDEHINLQLRNTRTFMDLRGEIFQLKELFASSDVKLEATSDLYRQLIEAIAYITDWERGETGNPDWLLSLRFVDSVVQAVLPLGDLPIAKRRRYLMPLLSGNLHPLARAKSNAKDILWELTLWSICRQRGFEAELEEPDILLGLKSRKVGLSCKKVYSEKNVEKVLSVGVSQLAKAAVPGIIAVNVDDLLGEGQVVIAPDHYNYFGCVSNMNVEFIVRHQRLLEKYLPVGRAIAVLVSCQDFGYVNEELHLTRQFAIWAHPHMPSDSLDLLHEFRDGLLGPIGEAELLADFGNDDGSRS